MKERAPRNRTLTCTEGELATLAPNLLHLSEPAVASSLVNAIAQQDVFEAMKHLPQGFVDLLILDPPYNLSKDFNGHLFKAKEKQEYTDWFASLLSRLKPTLKPDATVYVCADWKTSLLIAPVLEEHFCVRNRITWEREKGRGAKANWKNNTEDIWFCTVCEDFVFDVEAVKLKRKVIAPYRDAEGKPKDWDEGECTIVLRHWAGRNSRGVTQFEGKTINSLISSPTFVIDQAAAAVFIRKLIAL